MRAVVQDDLVLGIVSGDVDGIDVPAGLTSLPPGRLRLVNGAIVDISARTDWFLDSIGQKRVVQLDPSWTLVSCAWDAAVVNDGGLWRVQSAAEALTLAKDLLKADIDQQAEAQRTKLITPGSGQAMVYQEKAAEADQFAADPAPTNDKYPLLAATIGIDGATLADVAASVTSTRSLWKARAAQIENIRLSTKAAIDAAADVAGAQAAADAVNWG